MRARSICWLVAVLAAACRPAPQEALALRVEYAGCRDVVSGACVAPAHGRLTVWVQTPVGAETDTNAGARAAAHSAPVEVQGGARYVVEIQPDAEALIVNAHTATTQSTWRLPFASAPAADVLTAARTAIDGGDLEGGRAMLDRELDT